MWEAIIINSFIGIISQVLKNSTKATQLKATLLAIRDAINLAYPASIASELPIPIPLPSPIVTSPFKD